MGQFKQVWFFVFIGFMQHAYSATINNHITLFCDESVDEDSDAVNNTLPMLEQKKRLATCALCHVIFSQIDMYITFDCTCELRFHDYCVKAWFKKHETKRCPCCDKSIERYPSKIPVNQKFYDQLTDALSDAIIVDDLGKVARLLASGADLYAST